MQQKIFVSSCLGPYHALILENLNPMAATVNSLLCFKTFVPTLDEPITDT